MRWVRPGPGWRESIIAVIHVADGPPARELANELERLGLGLDEADGVGHADALEPTFQAEPGDARLGSMPRATQTTATGLIPGAHGIG